MNAKYILSYVNMDKVADATKNYDKEFKTMIQLLAFVVRNHRDWTSFQIIVVRIDG